MQTKFNRTWIQLDEEPAANFPMTLYYVAGAIAAKRVKSAYGPIALIYRGRSVRECTAPGGFVEPGRKILAKLEKDRSFLPWMWKNTSRSAKKLLAFSLNLIGADLRHWSDKKLVDTYRHWVELATETLSYSVFGTVLEFEEPLLSGPLYRYLIEAAPEKYASQIGEVFSILTTPIVENENRLAEIALAKLVLRNTGVKKKLKLTSQWIESQPQLLIKIRNYHERFSYLSYGYSGPKKSIHETIEDFIIHARQPREKLNFHLTELVNADRVIRKKQQFWLKKLRVEKTYRRLFSILRDIGGLKRWRKKLMVRCQCLAHELLVEISRRLKLPLIAIQSISPWQLEAVAVRKIGRTQVRRWSQTNVVWIENGSWKTLADREARLVIKEIDKSLKVKVSVKELTGMCACAGRATGEIKILRNASDLSKFDAGDIIVSPATSPELVPAMRRAAAIITDAGGITSHAAIISRELGVPCVIGTKIATKVFKDGDRV